MDSANRLLSPFHFFIASMYSLSSNIKVAILYKTTSDKFLTSLFCGYSANKEPKTFDPLIVSGSITPVLHQVIKKSALCIIDNIAKVTFTICNNLSFFKIYNNINIFMIKNHQMTSQRLFDV